ncbi:GNAT family N-acetyltransferase [Fulvivirga ligni]|uniref:GNAT family N-acetyltransferase n=1 Tax=Fulvivirga ligni TaxID=2904246 RepID=UPI001F2FADA2|nr:GNAT family N-acetyltransferase [Fulvivirga ligni]UII21374.1 GNAT family N-acetyltransferase [Fulvivirga ligni]
MGKYFFLSKIYVLSTCRGKGIGKKMMEYVVNQAKTINAGKIRLTVNKYNSGSIAAYHKMGFETVDSVNTDIGEGYFMDDYVLELPVNQ